MKVVIFSRYPQDIDKPRGGVESVAVVLVRALARRGDTEVHVVTLESGCSSPTIEDSGPVVVHRLPGSRWPQIADILIGPGRRRLTHYILSLKPDIVHTHETYGLTLGEIGIPHVFTVHGFDHANLQADSARLAWLRCRLWRAVERYGLARQRHIISIAPYVRSMVEPLTKATIYDVDNPVDERFFGVRRQEEGLRVLSMGWISERKNTLGLIQAFGRVLRRGIAATLVIGGEPKQPAYYQRVMACVDKEGLRDHVQFLGHISHQRLRDELARASLFVLPSRQENSPMAIAEAMAAGVPVVSSNRCGMPYMICEGETGYLVDPEDLDALAERMTRLLSDDALRTMMGQAARLAAENRFHPDKIAQRTQEVYRAVVGQTENKRPYGHSAS